MELESARCCNDHCPEGLLEAIFGGAITLAGIACASVHILQMRPAAGALAAREEETARTVTRDNIIFLGEFH